MMKSMTRRSRASANCSRASSMIEGLESRQLLSASLVTHPAPSTSAPLVHLMPASAKILAGKTSFQTVVIRNPGSEHVTQAVAITLAPSVDGLSACESYSTPGVTKTLTIKGHGSARVKVPFIVPATLGAGKYCTLATVRLGASTITVAAPSSYTLRVSPALTTTPNLVGYYTGVIKGTSYSHGNLMLDEATFSWDTTQQTTSCLNGYFAVGTGGTAGTMNGSELTSGKIRFTFKSAYMNYVVSGRVMHDGGMIKGSFRGKFAENVFPWVNGSFKIVRQAS